MIQRLMLSRPFSFWNYSLDELYDIISAHERKKKEMVRQEAISLQIQALQIRDCISAVLNGKDDSFTPAQLWDFYPSLLKRIGKSLKKRGKEKRSQALDLLVLPSVEDIMKH